MYKFKVGDLISKNIGELILKIGVVTSGTHNNIIVQWTSYNKEYFLEKEDDIFVELNNMYLLSRQSIDRSNTKACLELLSAS
jgi:hypothetical protein|tara:strand:- start:1046 stop:1291 length:246 start_codon:yes stop_codon:yes gene_type:complete